MQTSEGEDQYILCKPGPISRFDPVKARARPKKPMSNDFKGIQKEYPWIWAFSDFPKAPLRHPKGFKQELFRIEFYVNMI
uniref:Uncharacterized protein n=1 Tax=viral metagenome TaxID=1070528 RepID=A0A6H1Z5W9_9ZZZZ